MYSIDLVQRSIGKMGERTVVNVQWYGEENTVFTQPWSVVSRKHARFTSIVNAKGCAVNHNRSIFTEKRKIKKPQ